MLSTSFNSLSRVRSSAILKITANFNHTCLVSPISSRPPAKKTITYNNNKRGCIYLGQWAFLLSAVFVYGVIVFAFCENDKWRHAGLSQDFSAFGQQQILEGTEWWEEGTKFGSLHMQLEAITIERLAKLPLLIIARRTERGHQRTQGRGAVEYSLHNKAFILIITPPLITELWVRSSAEKPNS